jgi:hypothetical protein
MVRILEQLEGCPITKPLDQCLYQFGGCQRITRSL